MINCQSAANYFRPLGWYVCNSNLHYSIHLFNSYLLPNVLPALTLLSRDIHKCYQEAAAANQFVNIIITIIIMYHFI